MLPSAAPVVLLDYRPAPEVEAIPGPTVVGEKYLLVCERSLQLEREWAEAKLIVEGEYPTPPSYVNARVVPMQSLQVAGVQTEPEVPSTMEVGALTSDLELAHAKHSVMARIGTITLSTGIEVWMLQNFIRSLRGGVDALPKMHEARLLMDLEVPRTLFKHPKTAGDVFKQPSWRETSHIAVGRFMSTSCALQCTPCSISW